MCMNLPPVQRGTAPDKGIRVLVQPLAQWTGTYFLSCRASNHAQGFVLVCQPVMVRVCLGSWLAGVHSHPDSGGGGWRGRGEALMPTLLETGASRSVPGGGGARPRRAGPLRGRQPRA